MEDKASKLAKKYCEGSSFEDACMEMPAYIAGYHQAEKDLHKSIYKAGVLDGFEDAVEGQYEKGYEQAEKDLELTWEDMMIIHKCIKDAMNYHLYKMMEGMEGQKVVYQEVLKRFRDFKERKEK